MFRVKPAVLGFGRARSGVQSPPEKFFSMFGDMVGGDAQSAPPIHPVQSTDPTCPRSLELSEIVHTETHICMKTPSYNCEFEITTGVFARKYHDPGGCRHAMNPNKPEIVVFELDDVNAADGLAQVSLIIDAFSQTLCVVVISVSFPKDDLFETDTGYYVNNARQVDALTEIVAAVADASVRCEVIFNGPVDDDIIKLVSPLANAVTTRTIKNAVSVGEWGTISRLAFDGTQPFTPKMATHIGADVDCVHVFRVADAAQPDPQHSINFERGLSRIINRKLPTCIEMCATAQVISVAEKLFKIGDVSRADLAALKSSAVPCTALSHSVYFRGGMLYPCRRVSCGPFNVPLSESVQRTWYSLRFKIIRDAIASGRQTRDCLICPMSSRADIEDIVKNNSA